MKIRNFLMIGVFVIALAGSLVLKANNKRILAVTFHPFYTPFACLDSQVAINCGTTVTELQCTVYEPLSGTDRQAFAKDLYGGPSCVYPLYMQFF